MGKQGQFQKRGSIEASLACIQIRRSRAWPCHVIDRWAAKHRIGCVVLLKPGRNLARPRQSFSALYLARISLTLFSPSSFSTDRSRVSTNPCVQPCAPAYRNPWSRAVRSLHRVPTTIHLLSEFRGSHGCRSFRQLYVFSTAIRGYSWNVQDEKFCLFGTKRIVGARFTIVINSIFFTCI